ncbi:MAG: hypothetical protein ACAH65_09530 [Chloroflexota bacterium]
MRRLLGIGGALVLALGILVPVALAADGALPQTGRVLISVEGDVSVPAGEHADVVVVVNGHAAISGEVNTIVVVDGSADLTGATTESIVAVRSPVNLGPDSVVRGDVMTVDSLVHKEGNAQVQGTVRDMAMDLAGFGLVLASALFLLWIGFAIAAIAAGLLLAALAARQVRAAEALISHEPGQTFLAALVGLIVPMFVIGALFATVVGAPLGAGILVGLWPLAAFLGYLVAGIWIGDWVLGRMSSTEVRERPYLAAVIGIVILEIAGIFPLLPFIAGLFGYGAVILLAWRTFRGPRVAQTAVPTSVQAPVPG